MAYGLKACSCHPLTIQYNLVLSGMLNIVFPNLKIIVDLYQQNQTVVIIIVR